VPSRGFSLRAEEFTLRSPCPTSSSVAAEHRADTYRIHTRWLVIWADVEPERPALLISASGVDSGNGPVQSELETLARSATWRA
jgi:hypothetical protein